MSATPWPFSMSWLEFFAAVIGHLAWPVTAIVGFFILKRYLGALFPFIERFKYKEFEVQFRQGVAKAVAESASALPDKPSDEQSVDVQDRLLELAQVSPRAAILSAWLQIESAAVDALQSAQPPIKEKAHGVAPLRLGRLLNDREIINGAQLAIFDSLRNLRNQAVHVNDVVFKPAEVAEYIVVALSLASQIKRRTYPPPDRVKA